MSFSPFSSSDITPSPLTFSIDMLSFFAIFFFYLPCFDYFSPMPFMLYQYLLLYLFFISLYLTFTPMPCFFASPLRHFHSLFSSAYYFRLFSLRCRHAIISYCCFAYAVFAAADTDAAVIDFIIFCWYYWCRYFDYADEMLSLMPPDYRLRFRAIIVDADSFIIISFLRCAIISMLMLMAFNISPYFVISPLSFSAERDIYFRHYFLFSIIDAAHAAFAFLLRDIFLSLRRLRRFRCWCQMLSRCRFLFRWCHYFFIIFFSPLFRLFFIISPLLLICFDTPLCVRCFLMLIISLRRWHFFRFSLAADADYFLIFFPSSLSFFSLRLMMPCHTPPSLLFQLRRYTTPLSLRHAADAADAPCLPLIAMITLLADYWLLRCRFDTPMPRTHFSFSSSPPMLIRHAMLMPYSMPLIFELSRRRQKAFTFILRCWGWCRASLIFAAAMILFDYYAFIYDYAICWLPPLMLMPHAALLMLFFITPWLRYAIDIFADDTPFSFSLFAADADAVFLFRLILFSRHYYAIITFRQPFSLPFSPDAPRHFRFLSLMPPFSSLLFFAASFSLSCFRCRRCCRHDIFSADAADAYFRCWCFLMMPPDAAMFTVIFAIFWFSRSFISFFRLFPSPCHYFLCFSFSPAPYCFFISSLFFHTLIFFDFISFVITLCFHYLFRHWCHFIIFAMPSFSLPSFFLLSFFIDDDDTPSSFLLFRHIIYFRFSPLLITPPIRFIWCFHYFLHFALFICLLMLFYFLCWFRRYIFIFDYHCPLSFTLSRYYFSFSCLSSLLLMPKMPA